MQEISGVVEAIDLALPDLARSTIGRHLDLDDPANRDFLLHPDAREQHQSDWHQWGIITHTRRFREHFAEDVPRCLREWRLWEPADAILRSHIDGVGRWQLLQVSILLHDIGKFGARTQGRHSFHFSRHEELSGRVIRNELDLGRFGLTVPQIEYVARTAEDHFVLGLVRKRARESGTFDRRFVEGTELRQIACDIKRDHPDDFVEVGVLFLGDSLAKVDPPDGPRRAVDQYDLNVAVAHRYLAIVLEGEPTC